MSSFYEEIEGYLQVLKRIKQKKIIDQINRTTIFIDNQNVMTHLHQLKYYGQIKVSSPGYNPFLYIYDLGTKHYP